MKKPLVVSTVIIFVLIAFATASWLLLPLFISRTVDEAFPFELTIESELMDLSPDEAEQILEDAIEGIDEEFVAELSPEQAEEMEEKVKAVATLMHDPPMEDEMPESKTDWVLVTQGQFQDADNSHHGSGTASIFKQGEQTVLRFEDFKVTNGPDLHVLLVENVTASQHDAIGNYVDLGSLKGNMGSQNY